jgi:hypothetical protein
MKLSLLAAALLCLRLAANAAPVDDMAAAAKTFLAALNDDQRSKASFAFDSDERDNWHFVPRERKGLTLKEMIPAQRALVFSLLNSGMSQRGFAQATTIMSLEQVLQEMEGPSRRFPRDAELYHVSIFGTPDAKGTWGWRVEGHHLSVNFTVVDGKVAAGTPSFMGTNPAEIRKGPRAGLRVLAGEEDVARELVNSLNEKQKAVAVIDTKAPDDIATLDLRKVEPSKPAGITLGSLSSAQRDIAVRLIRTYVERLRGEVAASDFAKIQKAGLDKVSFAWAGSLEKGQRHYYRVQGPTFLLEYDNTQNDANHVHAVWRNYAGDFGRDALAEHLKSAHGK